MSWLIIHLGDMLECIVTPGNRRLSVGCVHTLGRVWLLVGSDSGAAGGYKDGEFYSVSASSCINYLYFVYLETLLSPIYLWIYHIRNFLYNY